MATLYGWPAGYPAHMVYSPVAWAFKDQITSAKLAQMVENTLVHDHRSDGTQGDPMGHLVPGAWTTGSPVAVAAGVAAACGSVTIPALKRDATLFVATWFTPTAANAGQVGLVVGAGDTRIAAIGPFRWGYAAAAVAQMSTYPIAVVAGGAQGAVSLSMTPQHAGSCRTFVWLQG